MSRTPFIILGVSENATKEELYSAYREMRVKYESQRFEPGEIGEEACAKLEEIDSAYNDALDIISKRSEREYSDYRTEYVEQMLNKADQAIRDGKIDEAQGYLDDCSTRTARWHYLQSAVFYRKNWVGDALKQLELACNMDPSNTKYRDAKASMEQHMRANTTSQESSFYNNGNRQERSYADTREYHTHRRGCTVCDICNGLICADCCCECCGGDLISCC